MASGISHPRFWGTALAVVLLDWVTKRIAVAALADRTIPVLGDWLTLRLIYNPGAAFGIHAGPYSRWIFMALALVALVVLVTMARHTPAGRWFRLTALALVAGGAVGNLVDRVTSARGVVDFIDVWIGSFHWPTFNVADSAVTCGALALAVVLWQEGRHHEEHAAEPTGAAEA